jgi:hypothetical protein
MAMTFTLSRTNKAPRAGSISLHAALLVCSVLVFRLVCFAQNPVVAEKAAGPTSKTATDPTLLTNDERTELLNLIRGLQARLDKLEAVQAAASSANTSSTSVAGVKAATNSNDGPDVSPVVPVAEDSSPDKSDETKFDGRYTPNLGFRLANTEYGDLNVSLYTYARYLNQRALNSTYTDAFGNVKSVQQRQDFQLNKVQIKFLGWIMNPKLRYFLYAWTSNANQGLGAQVVLAGNLNYTFNKYVTLGAGITSLPGTRSVEGNFPFWLGVDSRMIADEFFRGSYTSGIWARGDITSKLRYQVMVGNNLSTLGVPASRIDKHFNTVSSALIWAPTTGEFGAGFGDFEDHQRLATRLAFHFSRSDENKESQPSSDSFENTQLRLSDGTVIFTPDLFGPGITITDARYRMTSFDGGLKYKGYSLEGEYYMRWLDNFRGPGTAGLASLFDQGYQIQGAAMVIPKTLQAYVGQSKIFGQYGNPWDFRAGVNWFPWKNRVVRWNNEWLYLRNSPVGYTSVPFAVGGRGSVFHSSLELAF